MKKPSIAWYFPKIARRTCSRGEAYRFFQQSYTLESISINGLVASGIRGVILDLDNTVISEDDRYLSPNAEVWIQKAKQANLQFFILSNGKRKYRVRYWSDRLAVPAISPAKKPFPYSFRKAMKHMELTPKQVVVIGDSRHTDVLGAWIAGCSSIQVASLPHPPRWWEKIIGRWVQSTHLEIDELLLFDDSKYF